MEKNEYIDDLSWSNIVKLVQGDEINGANLINICAIELEEVRSKIEELQREINRVKSREQTLLRASVDITRHLKRELPLTVQRNKYIVIVSKDNIYIERNVI